MASKRKVVKRVRKRSSELVQRILKARMKVLTNWWIRGGPWRDEPMPDLDSPSQRERV